MGTDNTEHLSGLTAAADLSGSQHRFAAISGANAANIPSAGARADGVIYNDPEAGEAVDLAIGPKVKVRCAGAITAGAYVTGDASGNAVAVTSSDVRNGIAMEAGASGRYIPIKFGYFGVEP